MRIWKIVYVVALVIFAGAFVILGARSQSMEPVNYQDINHTPAPATMERCK